MSQKLSFKNLVVITGLLLSTSVSFSAPLDFSDLVGKYELVETQRGLCPPVLGVIEGEFLNQKAERSLTFSGLGSQGEFLMLYDLIALNAGSEFKLIPNPMLGGYVGTLYRKEELKSGRITALRRTRSMLGLINTQDQLDAKFSGETLTYTYSTYNSLIRPIVNRTDVCQFKKIDSAN